MDLLIFIAGVILGYFIEKILDIVLKNTTKIYKQKIWQKAERIWNKIQDISEGLELIQAGWKNDQFGEDQVIITIDDEFRLSPPLAAKTFAIHHHEWEEIGLENNQQIGVSKIDPHRISDEIDSKGKTHELRIHGQTYHYFEFMSTHHLLRLGSPEDKAFLPESLGEIHYLEPAQFFPNPLSVGLSLFCEGGDYLVLTKRTKLISSGGLIWGNQIYNAVGENVTLEDVAGTYGGVNQVSVWNTARRGLREEMGIQHSRGNELIIMHSFVWDKRILDYKFFGYVISDKPKSSVMQSWMYAPDRHESWEINLHRLQVNAVKCRALIEEIFTHRDQWASESALCTIRSLLHSRKISPRDFENIVVR